MQELIESMVRFSTAMTLFGVQQLQNVIDLTSETSTTRKKVRTSLDAVTHAVTDQLDANKKLAIDSASKLFDTTFDAFPVFDASKLVDNVTEVMRKAADTMSDAITKASQKDDKDEADQPVQASTILTAEA